ncbi:hypothetical protein [Natronocalculus amylovorans]|uniref:Uncharacterized protein n=1 Tax=Natronocalculus amylovorans TaxID=2917812 RepID=A0AAE3K8Z2_9EURY|nr:hypothetical protein [Natronocalculus amylovorans]MCL9817543.1 hypothetical protein [Natronocalculus amylovorans]
MSENDRVLWIGIAVISLTSVLLLVGLGLIGLGGAIVYAIVLLGLLALGRRILSDLRPRY